MEFRKEDALVASGFDECFEHRRLILEVILLAKKTGKAAVLVVNWTHRRTLGTEVMNLEPVLLQNSLQALRPAIWQCHFLYFTTMFCNRICGWNYGIMLVSLLSAI